MRVALMILGLSLAQGGAADPPRLNVRAERGLGGVQADGWQHIALRIENSSGQPIAGHATLYEWDSQVGARPRIVQPFAVTDRQIIHFYPFRPPETPQPSSYVITIEDQAGQPISFDGGSQWVIHGQSTRAVKVDMGSGPSGDFRVAIWGDNSPFFRSLVNEWSPPLDDILRSRQGMTPAQWQRITRGNGRLSPEAVALEDPRMFPDSYVGYGDLRVFVAYGIDFDQISERQRRALDDWVNSGGVLVYIPRKAEQLTGPFFRDLIGIQSRGEVTTNDDQHLPLDSQAGPPHHIVHFLTALEPARPIEVRASYKTQPVVYSTPAGYGRLWIVAFDPDSHGGLRRYKPLWTDILNQIVRRDLIDGRPPTGLASQRWSAEDDRKWLARLSERFGKSPSIEHLAILILGYLLVIGPANFLILKRREARVWLIGTVPILAVIFGGFVLSMGYLSHGWRAATNYLALAVVTPDGDRSFAEEYVAVYGTTSAEYQLEFPRHLHVRPLSEFVANPNGGFENLSSFKLQVRDDRQFLNDWRLTFWQTRGTATLDCIPCGGRLTARRNGNEITISNETEMSFDRLLLVSDGQHAMGPLQSFETATVELVNSGSDSTGDLDSKKGAGHPLSVLMVRGKDSAVGSDSPSAESRAGDWAWPDDESLELLEAARSRVGTQGGEWVLGLTRQIIHTVRSANTARQNIATVYAWPVTAEGGARSARPTH